MSDEDRVRAYVSGEGKENVISVEHAATFECFGVERDVWRVETSDNSWWVVDQPMNFYPAAKEETHLTPPLGSAETAFSFHMGIVSRLMSQEA